MKLKSFTFLFFILIVIACGDNTSDLHDQFVGEWVYERETFNSGIVFEDPDINGIMRFNANETGTWQSNATNSFQATDFQWDLQYNDDIIVISKRFSFNNEGDLFSNTNYTITSNNQDQITLTDSYKIEGDSIDYERFENIILTRVK